MFFPSQSSLRKIWKWINLHKLQQGSDPTLQRDALLGAAEVRGAALCGRDLQAVREPPCAEGECSVGGPGLQPYPPHSGQQGEGSVPGADQEF